ncbi:hypothetical protein [Pseudomonas sp. RGM2987]|uniref:hypothetical protein n=1 Tax=Pseudomonas sp. RGM2987 TaxID=2930090 RepID=UPI001FD638CE|nr:hypothetical protein [Pseudomonas sp. RGM2987]MCJ8205189.1 hypothetical protein [Pseudomonas sp. RGM2987]
MTQRGYPGIHAGMPTTQCLRSALVVNGALKIKSQSKSEAVWQTVYFSELTQIQLWGLPAKTA